MAGSSEKKDLELLPPGKSPRTNGRGLELTPPHESVGREGAKETVTAINTSKRKGGLLLAAALLTTLFVIAAAVIFWLPKVSKMPHDMSSKKESNTSPVPDENRALHGDRRPKERAPQESSDPSGDEAASEQDKELYRQARARWLEKRAWAEVKNMPVWGGEPYKKAVLLAKKAEDAALSVRHGRSGPSYRQAAELYQKAAAILSKLERDRPAIFKKALEDGQRALANWDAKGAEKAFSIALSADPDSRQAAAGLRRAKSLDEVHALLLKADKLLAPEADMEELKEAAMLLESALKLDSSCKPAETLLSRTRERIKKERFQRALGQGISALAAGRLTAAAKALRTAQALYPEDPAVLDLSKRLKAARKAAQLKTLLRQADAAFKKEDFQAAAGLCRKALTADPLSLEARACLDRAEKLMAVEAGLKKIVSDPMRLMEEGPYKEAANLVEEAKKGLDALSPGGRLSALLHQADRIVRLARRPVLVTITSDNETDVVIYRVGRLGRFSKRSIRLLPGRYVLAGSRRGYRDVRVKLEIPPGSERVDVQVGCNDPLL